jgi:hypothetical protein
LLSISILSLASNMVFRYVIRGLQLLVLLGPALYYLVGPWNGIRPQPAMTLRNDAMLLAKYGACFAMSSRVVISIPLPSLNNIR